MKKTILLAVISTCVLPALLFAQGWNIEMLDLKYTNWHPADVVACQGDYAYLGLEYYSASAGGIAIIDNSNPEYPMEVAYFETIDDIFDIEIYGNYAYVGHWGEGLQVLDISNPLDPVEVRLYSDPAYIEDIFVAGNLAYMSCINGGLTIADISDPANINILSNYTFGGYGGCVCAYENIVYLCGEDILRIIDANDPANPIPLSNMAVPSTPHDFAVYEGHLYTSLYYDGMYIYDLSNPVNPHYVSNITGEALDVVVADDIAYTRNGTRELQMFDVSDPSSPTFINSCATSGDMMDIAHGGDFIYAAYDDNGLKVIDVSNTSLPIVYPCYEPDWWIYSVELDGNYAYVTDCEQGFMVLDVSDPSHMFQAAYLNNIGSAYDIYTVGEYAYVFCPEVGYQVIAIVDPLNPRVEGNVNLDGTIKKIDEETNTMFVSGEHDNLHIYDCSSATNPQLISTYTLIFGVYGIAWFNDVEVDGNLMYGIAYYYEPGEGGPLGDSLLVLDITDPTDPSFVSMTNLGGGSTQIELRDNLAYIGAEHPMLRILDISDPHRPAPVSSINYPGTAENMVLKYDYVYIQSSFDVNIRIIDISNPENPHLCGYYTTPDNAMDMSVGDEIIFVADWGHFESYNVDDAVWVKPGTQTEQPREFGMLNAYPNPFNQSSVVSYQLSANSNVNIKVYDITGREVARLVGGMKPAGQHQVVFDGSHLTSGVYFVRLEAGEFKQTRKILLIK